MMRDAREGVAAAHPRSRGENPVSAATNALAAGSSPLTRGKRRQHQGNQRPERLIPAHAGKTQSCESRAAGAPAHPRSRGENPMNELVAWLICGSSPLTRGKRWGIKWIAEGGRLIPAHAGKTSRARPTTCGPWAHPRSRGENGHPERRVLWKHGSSPLTRGKPSSTETVTHALRLIPAHAGKTTQPSPASTRSGGSSPLTRGKLKRVCDETTATRLIPAHAGKTAVASRLTGRAAAHPRSRGENSIQYGAGARRFGSSPLTRGKRVN